MSRIISNRQLPGNFCLMKVQEKNNAAPGQFYMLRAWEFYPVLSRPISVFDSDGETISFLYKVVGQGTEIFAGQNPGDEIQLLGPLGNGFPSKTSSGKIAMVGGGVGIAPLYYAAKTATALSNATVDLYLGFSDEPVLVDEYEKISSNVTVDVGGFITDRIEPSEYDYIFTCGPEAMMKALYEKCVKASVGDKLYVSMENRMACGIGACLVCSCKTVGGNKKACKDGPVFSAKAVFGI